LHFDGGVFCAGRNKQEELALLFAVLEIWHFFFLYVFVNDENEKLTLFVR
jgi:hypothetical protein